MPQSPGGGKAAFPAFPAARRSGRRTNSRTISPHPIYMYSAFMDYGEILVTGGTGFLGRHVARALIARGYLPRLLVRAGSGSRIPDDIRRACRVTPGDVTDPESVENAAQGTSAIVHLAGIVREIPRKGITFGRLHIKATRNAVKAARRWEISRFVHVSALGARPEGPGAFFESKAWAEEIVMNSDLRWTVFRPSAVFGPGDRFIDTMLRVLRWSPVAAVPGDGRVRYQPVHVEDVAHGIADAVTRPSTERRCIDMGGPESVSFDGIVDAVAGALGRTVAKVHVPLAILYSLARSLSRFERFPVSPEELDIIAAENICESGRYWAEIGRTPMSLRDYLAGVSGRRADGTAGIPRMEPKQGIEPPSRQAA